MAGESLLTRRNLRSQIQRARVYNVIVAEMMWDYFPPSSIQPHRARHRG